RMNALSDYGIYTLSLHDALPICYAVKIAQAFDIAAMHGLEPRSMTDASFKATNSFDGLVTDNVIEYNAETIEDDLETAVQTIVIDRKSTRLNSSHVSISYAVFCF